MVVTYEEIQRQIAAKVQEAEQVKRDAMDAERERLEALQAPQRAIAAKEQEIRDLAWQAATVRHSEISQAYQQVAADFYTRAAQMFAALEVAKFSEVHSHAPDMDQLRTQADHLRQEAANVIAPYRNQAWKEAYNSNVDGRAGVVELSQKTNADPEVASYTIYDLPALATPYDLIKQWVQSVPESRQRQERNGLSFAAFGVFGDERDGIWNTIRMLTYGWQGPIT